MWHPHGGATRQPTKIPPNAKIGVGWRACVQDTALAISGKQVLA